MSLGSFHSLVLCAMSAMLGLAIWHDLAERRIPNSLVLSGALAALALAMTPAGMGWASSVKGGAICFAIFLGLHLLRMVGAGDVKLVGAVGLFQGASGALSLCLTIMLAGGLLSIAWAAWHSQLMASCRNLAGGVATVVSRISGSPSTKGGSFQVSSQKVPYALAIGLGTAVHVVMRLWAR